MTKTVPELHPLLEQEVQNLLENSGVVKGGRGGAIAPPTASKTIFEKSLNPCKSVGGGGGVRVTKTKIEVN